MAKGTKGKKRRSDDASSSDTENLPPSPTLPPSKHTKASAPFSSLPPLSISTSTPPSLSALPSPLTTELESLRLDVEGRCDVVLHQSSADVLHLRQALSRQLLKLPPAVRDLSVKDFALTHSLSVTAVTMQRAMESQKQLEGWVQATPRMRGGRGRGVGELEALKEGGVLKEYMNVLMTAQRMTRATARKAGLIGGGEVGGGEVRGVLAIVPPNQAVYATPHSRKV